MNGMTAEQGATTAPPDWAQGQRPEPTPYGFHEPFDGMGYLDDVTEEPAPLA